MRDFILVTVFKKLMGFGYSDAASYSIQRQVMMLNVLNLIGVSLLLVFGSVNLYNNDLVIAFVDYIAAMIFLGIWLLARIGNISKISEFTTVIGFGLVFLIYFLTGAVNNNGIIWAFTYPLIGLLGLGFRWGTITSLSLWVLSLCIFLIPNFPFFTASYTHDFIIRFFIAYLVIFIISVLYERVRMLLVRTMSNKNRDLEMALAEVKKLRGFLPICAKCKKIRDDQGYWTQLEEYISAHSEAKFTHGLCNECVKEIYSTSIKR